MCLSGHHDVDDTAVVLVLTSESKYVPAGVPTEALLFVAGGVAEYGAPAGRGVLVVEIVNLNLILLVEVVLLQAGYQCAVEVERQGHHFRIVVPEGLNQKEVLEVPEPDQRVLPACRNVPVSIIDSK